MARGLILDRDGRIVARPFDKFFNLFERWDTEPEQLPKLPFTIEEKVDGSMGVVFFHKHEWRCSTKGSLESDQARFANEHLVHLYNYSDIDPNLTLLTEIIYPENRIVLDYGDFKGLKLLAARNRNTGVEVPAGRIPILADKLGMECRKTYDHKVECFSKLPMWEGMEGYVVRFVDDFRVKVKNPWYLRIHKALDSKTHKRILELIESGEYRAVLESLPKEIQKDFDDIYADLRMMLWDLERRAKEAMEMEQVSATAEAARKDPKHRKDFALAIRLNTDQDLFPLLFAMLDGKDYRHILFKIVRKKLKTQ